MNNSTNYSKFFKTAIICSFIAMVVRFSFLFFKGLNYGVDFNGGTLIEIRVSDKNIKIQQIRESLNANKLGEVNVKQFGKENDFLIKFEKNPEEIEKFISELKNNISKKIGSEVNFRRVESVGPKVSDELLKQGIIAIVLSFAGIFFLFMDTI